MKRFTLEESCVESKNESGGGEGEDASSMRSFVGGEMPFKVQYFVVKQRNNNFVKTKENKTSSSHIILLHNFKNPTKQTY